MKLKLVDQDTVKRPVEAAFLSGASPALWLRELDTWGINPDQMTIFPIATSVRVPEVAGLLVLFEGTSKPDQDLIRHPYGFVAGRLLIPVNATLFPAVSDSELEELMHWEYQLLHPHYGLSGFGPEDQLDLFDLLAVAPESSTEWNYAHPGLTPLPKLTELRLLEPEPKAMLEAIGIEMGHEPIREDETGEKEDGQSPDDEQDADSKGKGLFGGLKKKAIDAALGFSRKMKETDQERRAGEEEGQEQDGGDGGDGGGGFWGRVENWLSRQSPNLDKERKSQLDHLLDLFRRDPDAALRKAIPLDNTYQGRGMAPPSSNLGTRNPDFNLGSLGGGRASDGWDVDYQRYLALRKSYEEAAKQALEEGDHRKAAYVYANLLGNFHEAANVLRQGGFYREAAILYRDHLDNKGLAATCLEEGGFLKEAVELHLELSNYEKAGDLYRELGQEEAARVCYKQCVAEALERQDYLNAAHWLVQKLEDPEEAQKVLLKAWPHHSQAQQSMQQYLSLQAEREVPDWDAVLWKLYQEDTPPSKYNQWLFIMEESRDKLKDEQFDAVAREVAFDLISKQASGYQDNRNLYRLQYFLPGDQLLGRDASRYVSLSLSRAKKQQSHAAPINSFFLDASFDWTDVVYHRDQFIVHGRKENAFRFVRCNWAGETYEVTWHHARAYHASFELFISDPLNSNDVYLSGIWPQDGPFSQLSLPQSEVFQTPLLFTALNRDTRMILASGIQDKNRVVDLVLDLGMPYLRFMDSKANFRFRKSLSDNHLVFKREYEFRVQDGGICHQMIYRNGRFYLPAGDSVFIITDEGELENYPLSVEVKNYGFESVLSRFRIAISTAEEFIILKLIDEELEVEHVETFPFFCYEGWEVEILPDDYLVATCAGNESEGGKLLVYDLKPRHPEVVMEQDHSGALIKVIPASRRGHFGIVERTGKISLFSIPSR